MGNPDPYGTAYGMPPTPYGGQQGYGHPGMMQGSGHMHGGGYGGMLHSPIVAFASADPFQAVRAVVAA